MPTRSRSPSACSPRSSASTTTSLRSRWSRWRNQGNFIERSVAIPVSVVATFALIYFGGFTLNLMTLGGLALVVGMMVDSSIVVLENIVRRRDEEGESMDVAAVAGTLLPLAFGLGEGAEAQAPLARAVIGGLVGSTVITLVLIPVVFSVFHRDGDRAAVSEPDPR